MTTDKDLEELRSAYEQLRAENARLRERLCAAIGLALELSEDGQRDAELVRAALRSRP